MGGGGGTCILAGATTRTLVASWQVYCSRFGHSGVPPLKLGRERRMRGPDQPLLRAGGSAMEHTGVRRPCSGAFQGCSQLRRSSLCSTMGWLPASLRASSPAQSTSSKFALPKPVGVCKSVAMQA